MTSIMPSFINAMYLLTLTLTISLTQVAHVEANCLKFGPSLQIPLLYDGLLQYNNASDSITICPYGLSFSSDPFTIPIRDENGLLPGCEGPKGDTGPMGMNATCVDGTDGAQGPQGLAGQAGLHGINSGAFTYTYMFTTQGLPQEPGLGNVSYNGFDNSGPSSLNLITFSSVDNNGVNMSMLIDVLASKTTDTSDNLAFMQVTADTNGVVWSSFAVTGFEIGYDVDNGMVVYDLHVVQVGVSVPDFTPDKFLFDDGQLVGVGFSFVGKDGPVGPAGHNGPQGTNYTFVTQPNWATFSNWSFVTVRVNSSTFTGTNTGVDGVTNVYGLDGNSGTMMTVLSTVISFTDYSGTNVSSGNTSSIQFGYMRDSFKLVASDPFTPGVFVPISNTLYFSGPHSFNETNTFTLPTSTCVLQGSNVVGIQWTLDGNSNSSDSHFVTPPIAYDLIMTILVFPESQRILTELSKVSNDTIWNLTDLVPADGFLAGWRNPGSRRSVTKYGNFVVNFINNDPQEVDFQLSYTSSTMAALNGQSSYLKQTVSSNTTSSVSLGFMLDADITTLTVQTKTSCDACFAYTTFIHPTGTYHTTALFSTLSQ